MKRLTSLLLTVVILCSSILMTSATEGSTDENTTPTVSEDVNQEESKTPTDNNTEDATEIPTQEVTVEPTQEETAEPTENVTVAPTQEQTVEPTQEETVEPTQGEEKVDYPVIIGVASDKDGLKITWNKFDGAYKYRLFVKNDETGKWKALVTTDKTSYVHKDLQSGKEYTYTLRAVDKDGNFSSKYKTEGFRFTYIACPVIKTITSVNGGLKITWGKVVGAENYKVYKKQGGTLKEIGSTTDTSFIDEYVVSGYEYTYTVRCVTADGTKFTSHLDAKGKTGLYVVAPKITKIENVLNGAKVTWGKVDGAAKYRLFYKLSDSSGWKTIGTTTADNFTHSSLKNGDEYTYTVRALDSKGNFASSFDSVGVTNTFVSAPKLTSVSSVQNGLKVEWSAVDGAVNYKVYVKKDSKWEPLGYTTETSFVDENVTSGKEYTYTVRCVTEDGKKFVSYFEPKGKKGLFVTVPEITKIENVLDGAKVTWGKVDGAAKYRLFYKLSDSSGWKTIGTTTADNFTHSSLKNGDEYTYTVRALDSKGNFASSFDSVGVTNTFVSAPKLTSVSSVQNGLKVEWSAVDGAVNYKVYVKKDSKWEPLGYTTETSFVDENVTSGKEYTYTVRCVTEDGKKFVSYFEPKGKKGLYVATPKITKVENVANGTKVSWTKVSGAYKYRLFYKLSDSSGWKTIGTTTADNFTHAPLKNGDEYVYTVRALDKNNVYVSSFDSKGVQSTFTAVPKITSVSSAFDGVEIKWNAVEGAVNYKVYVIKDGKWEPLGYTTSTSFVDENVSSGKKYTYTVRCVSEDGKKFTSYFDTKGASVTYVASPVITAVENQPSDTKVSWNKVAGAAKYKLFYKLSDSSGWKTIGTTTSTSFIHKNLNDGDVYTYTVRACNSSGAYISGYDKVGVTNTFIAPIVVTSVENVDGNMVLSWDKVDSAYGYRVYRKEFTKSWVKVSDVTETTFTDTTMPSDIPYTYTLRCINENGTTISYHTNDTKYYYNGELASGKITYGGESFNFEDGHLKQGYVTINGSKYYYNKDGVMLKNCVVGSEKEGYCYATASGVIDSTVRKAVTQNGVDWNVLNGKAYKVKTTADRTLFRAFKEVDKALKGKDVSKLTKEQKLKICFDYVKDAYVEKNPRIPHYHGMDWPQIYANDMFVNGVGNCFSYGAAFAYMAKAIGYEDVYCCHSGGHGWAEIDGLVYDPEWSRHHFYYSYYALSYNTKTDQNYKGAIAPGYAWMHVKI